LSILHNDGDFATVSVFYHITPLIINTGIYILFIINGNTIGAFMTVVYAVAHRLKVDTDFEMNPWGRDPHLPVLYNPKGENKRSKLTVNNLL